MRAHRIAATLLATLPWTAPATGMGAEPHGNLPRPLDFEVLRSVRQVGAPVLSPDGEWVVFPIDEPTEAGSRRSNLWLRSFAAAEPEKRLTQGDVRDRDPVWSPDGRFVAFLSDRSGSQQLWWTDAPGAGEPRQATSLAGGVSGFAWAPGSDRVVVVTRVVDAHDGPGPPPDGLRLVDLDDGEVEGLPAAGFGVAVDWSPDGRTIAYSAQSAAGFFGAQESDLFLLDLETGASRMLVARPGIDHRPDFSPEGGAIAFITGFGASGLLPNLGVSIVDVATGEIRDVGQSYDRGGFFEGPTRVEWSPDGGSIYFNASHGTAERVVRLDLESHASHVFTEGPLSYGAANVAGQADVMVLLATGFDLPSEVFGTPLVAFRPRQLTRSNPQLAGVSFPRAEIVRWNAPDGLEISGLLLLPPDHQEGPLPLVVSLHGGPATSVGVEFPGLGFFYNPYRDDLLAGHGYAVLLPNPRGSGGFGSSFRRAAVGDWGRGPLTDVLAGVDALVESGIADPERLGIMGWSYGGYLTAWAVTATDRFRAASVGAGVFDLESHFGQGREQLLEYFGGPPWESPGVYAENSPSTYVGRVTTPVQVIHGRDDTAVSPAQSEYLAASLRTLGVEHEVLFYPGEGHALRDPEIQEASWIRVRTWFDRWLQTESSSARAAGGPEDGPADGE